MINRIKNNSSVKNDKGFTLIELIVTIILSGIVVIIITITFISGIRGLDAILSQRRLTQEGELGLAKFTREATLINTVYTANATQFSFSTNQFPGVTIVYDITGSGLYRNAGSGQKLMVANIDAGNSSFTYFDIGGGTPPASIDDIHRIQLSLLMQNLNQSMRFTADVFPVLTRFES
jgi:prepilin-type N-terminal cleavage/methylation domain-containing protein